MNKYAVAMAILALAFVLIASWSFETRPFEEVSISTNEEVLGEQMALNLYRNPDTRESVIQFFTQIAGDREVAQAILTACDEHNVSPILTFALVKKESHFRPTAVGYNFGSRDVGLFQLNSLVYPNLAFADAINPLVNSRLGVKHLRESIFVVNDIANGLAVYNAGIVRVQANQIPQSTKRYVAEVLQNAELIEKDFFQNIVSSALAANSIKSPKRYDVLSGGL
jgi:soluble lytic murein transglycosylase-like protein